MFLLREIDPSWHCIFKAVCDILFEDTENCSVLNRIQSLRKAERLIALARVHVLAATTVVVVFACPAQGPAYSDDENGEASMAFDGKRLDSMKGGTWKVVYSSAEGPEGRALEVLTERYGTHFLREGYTTTALVLPLERDGGEKVKSKRDVIVIGRPCENATLRKLLGDAAIPKGGYLIRTFHKDGRNFVLLAGDTPESVLWATFDFLDVTGREIERQWIDGVSKCVGQSQRYALSLFRADKLPEFTYRTAPETPIRSVFSWGQVVDDCRNTFRALARARFNRIILWNDQYVVNHADVVREAHSWGVEVYWGFSWGWTLSGTKDGHVDLGALADGIVDEWRSKWKSMGGDGIYFQSFTETANTTIGGKSIPEAVVSLVNGVASRIRGESPGIDIVFGLHSNSMRKEGAASAIAKTDPSLEILWENCGGFPYWEADGSRSDANVAFTDTILSLTPRVGLVWKAQLRMDWKNYVAPAGPFLLGRAGDRVLARDQAVARPKTVSFDEDWVVNGRHAYDLVRHVRAGAHPPVEFNAVAEYNPPYAYSTLVQAELFWGASDSWEDVSRRARLRACPEW